MKNNHSITSYLTAFEDIKKRVHEARYKSFQAVNTELIKLYWDLGKTIVEKQEKEKWGDSTIDQLSKDLQNEFPSVKGFSRENLFRMKRFYQAYKANIIVSQLVTQLGWSHNFLIFSKCKDPLEREFYIRMTISQGWSRHTLEDKVSQKEFERWAVSQNNFKETLPIALATKGENLLKDDYNFSFLEISESLKEKKLESKIIENIDKFIKEMDCQLMFAGRQVKLEFSDEEFFIDFLFYHKILRSYIVIELKVGKFQPEYAGKMAFYLGAIENKFIDQKHDNPTIGIILCKEKNRDVVNASLKFIARPVGVATYKTYSNQEQLPTNIKEYFPNNDKLTTRLLKIL